MVVVKRQLHQEQETQEMWRVVTWKWVSDEDERESLSSLRKISNSLLHCMEARCDVQNKMKKHV